jgi:hypothetical protein
MFKNNLRIMLLLLSISISLILSGCTNPTENVLSQSNEKNINNLKRGSQEMKWGFASYNVKNIYEWDGSLSLEQRIDRLIVDLKAANSKWYRPNFIWCDIEAQCKRASMTRSEISSYWINRYAFPENYSDWQSFSHFYKPDWSVYDLLVDKLDNNNINIFAVICNGDYKQMPLYNGEGIYPGSAEIDNESYMAHAKLHAAGVALRYKDKIQYYQAENELNAAGLQVYPWLARKGYDAWNDWDFQTELLRTISDGIKYSDNTSLISTNFVVIGCDWHSHVDDWTSGSNADILDIVGVDVYSNYLYGWPVDDHSVGGCVEEAYQNSNGKPVIVSETGYPTQPWYLGYNESRQAYYVKENMEDAWDKGAKGFFYYRLITKESSSSGGFPQESYWGFVRKNDTYKPALNEFHDKTIEHPYIK